LKKISNVSKCESVAPHERAMITKEDAVDIAARFLRASGYAINSQAPTCRFTKKSDVLQRFQSPESLAQRKKFPKIWDSMVEMLARDRWNFTFTVGEEQERVWQIIEVEVDDQTGIASACLEIPPQNPPKLPS